MIGIRNEGRRMEPDGRLAVSPNGSQVCAANTHACLEYPTFDTHDLIYRKGSLTLANEDSRLESVTCWHC